MDETAPLNASYGVGIRIEILHVCFLCVGAACYTQPNITASQKRGPLDPTTKKAEPYRKGTRCFA